MQTIRRYGLSGAVCGGSNRPHSRVPVLEDGASRRATAVWSDSQGTTARSRRLRAGGRGSIRTLRRHGPGVLSRRARSSGSPTRSRLRCIVEKVRGGSGRTVSISIGQYEGPPGCVHGGVIALVFDELLGAANIAAGSPGMTGTLTIRYREPTPIRTEIRLESTFRGPRGPQDQNPGCHVQRSGADRRGRGGFS